MACMLRYTSKPATVSGSLLLQLDHDLSRYYRKLCFENVKGNMKIEITQCKMARFNIPIFCL